MSRAWNAPARIAACRLPRAHSSWTMMTCSRCARTRPYTAHERRPPMGIAETLQNCRTPCAMARVCGDASAPKHPTSEMTGRDGHTRFAHLPALALRATPAKGPGPSISALPSLPPNREPAVDVSWKDPAAGPVVSVLDAHRSRATAAPLPDRAPATPRLLHVPASPSSRQHTLPPLEAMELGARDLAAAATVNRRGGARWGRRSVKEDDRRAACSVRRLQDCGRGSQSALTRH